jgi:hypothetical protein
MEGLKNPIELFFLAFIALFRLGRPNVQQDGQAGNLPS